LVPKAGCAPYLGGEVEPAVGLCLGSNYDASIRARANGTWGPYSSSINFNL
jgi:hypothetical protein